MKKLKMKNEEITQLLVQIIYYDKVKDGINIFFDEF